MMTSAKYVLFLMGLVTATSCAFGGVRFQDDFNIPNGPDPKWDVISGSFSVQSQQFVPGSGAPNVALAKDAGTQLLLDRYNMTFWVGKPGGSADYFSVRVHQKDANNFFRVFATAQEKRAYWQAVVNGVWIFSSPRYPVSCTDLNWSSINVQIVVDASGATATLSDGVHSYSTTLPSAEIPTSLRGPSAIGLDQYISGPGTRFDNVVIDDNQTPPPQYAIGTAKAGGPGWYGYVRGFVTAVFTEYNKFVIESEDRSSAITVAASPGSLQIGQDVTVLGTVQSDGTFTPVEITPTGNSKVLEPVGVNNRDLTGSVGGTGLGNKDLLVTCWGKVLGTPAPFVTPGYGSTTFYIADGSATGSATAQVLGAWTLQFQDTFNTGRSSSWADYGTAPRIDNGTLAYDARCISWVKGVHLADMIITVDVVGGTTGQIGLIGRFVDVNNFLLANWLQSQNRIYFHEVKYGSYGSSLGDVYNVQLNPPSVASPVHMIAEIRGMVAKLTVSDGIRTYSSTIPLTRFEDPQLVGVFHDSSVNAIDNFKVYYPSAPMTVNGNIVQVTIPGSVAGAIPVNPGDYVRATGIVCDGSTLQGNLRGITIRKAEDLSKMQ
ncbi:MAG: hypothetical protein M1133_00705 [Armatimonadetes bacterium]|nr:hypothetical protein [Armatimonadota bacterium]